MDITEYCSLPFYKMAMDLFVEAEITENHDPVFTEHSAQNFVFFDVRDDVVLSIDRDCLNNVQNVSFLFSLKEIFDFPDESVGVYCAELICKKSMRSWAAYDFHKAVQNVLKEENSAILFKFEDEIMLTTASRHSKIYMSDWYNVTTEIDKFAEIIHICQLDFSSPRGFIESLSFCCARWYYVYPISEAAIKYTSLPVDFFVNEDNYPTDKKSTQEKVEAYANIAQKEYQNDFVEESDTVWYGQIGPELDLIAIEIEMNELLYGGKLAAADRSDDLDKSNMQVEEPSENDEIFSAVPPEIFADPIAMEHWLKKMDVSNDN